MNRNYQHSIMLALLPAERRDKAVRLLSYRKDSVGRLMTPDFIAIQAHWTVQETLEHIRTYGRDSETLNALYVVDVKGGLLDDIKIRELLLHPLETKIEELRKHRQIILHADESGHRATILSRKYNRTVLPVVDAERQLLGILTVDDILHMTEKMNTRTIQSIGGNEALDEPYLAISLARMFRKRGGWLVILFISEMLTATAMSFFEDEIARAVVLALFVSLTISSGGNSGSQASTLIIRALALGEIKLNDWWRVVRREFITGLSLGSLLGAIGFLRITLWSLVKPIYGPQWPLVALTVGIALVGVVLWGSLSGSMLPFILKRVKLDPATSSAPFVATLVDVTGLIIYFSVAYAVLKGTLL